MHGLGMPPVTVPRRLRVGVAGGGLIAQIAHLPTLRALDDRFELVGLADPSARVAGRLAARYGIPHVHADHRALLEHGLDALVVCSPNGLHAEAVLDALDAGAHVFVEKPLCLAPEDAVAIAARSRAAGLVVQVGYMKRFDPGYEALVEALEQGPADVVHVDSLTVDPGIGTRLLPAGFVAPDDVPRRVVARTGATTAAQVRAATGSEDPAHVAAFSGAFLGALVHDVNAVAGAISVRGARCLDAFAGPDRAGGTVALAGGARWTMAWMALPAAGPFSEELRLCAREGVFRLSFPAPYLRGAAARAVAESATGTGPGWTATARGAYADAYARELEHFHACVTGSVECRTPAAQAVADIELLTALYRAAMEAPAAA